MKENRNGFPFDTAWCFTQYFQITDDPVALCDSLQHQYYPTDSSYQQVCAFC